jgi:hypothetical protein
MTRDDVDDDDEDDDDEDDDDDDDNDDDRCRLGRVPATSLIRLWRSDSRRTVGSPMASPEIRASVETAQASRTRVSSADHDGIVLTSKCQHPSTFEASAADNLGFCDRSRCARQGVSLDKIGASDPISETPRSQ